MKALPRSRDGRSYAQPGGSHVFQAPSNEYRLSMDDSMHPTESISDLYGDDASSDGGSDYNHSRNNSSSTIANSSYTNPSTPPTTPDRRANRLSTANIGMSGSTVPSGSNGGSPLLGSAGSPTMRAPPNSPSLADAANHQFPLNDLDYESNPQAVQQELNNLQALRRMSMDVTNVANDPDLPTFNFIPSAAPKGVDNQDDPSRLFWVPARLHPELAPKEFKTFVESRVQQIRGHGDGGGEGLSPEGGLNAGPSLRRKKSMLSRQIDNSTGQAADHYEDGAESLRRQRSNSTEVQLKVSDIDDVISTDPADLVKQLTLSNTERALMGEPSQMEDDLPLFPAAAPGQSLRRSTRTAYRGGSLRKGKRVAPSRRGTRAGGEIDELSQTSPEATEPEFKLNRVQTEPVPLISISSEDDKHFGSPRGRKGSGEKGPVTTYSVNELKTALSPRIHDPLPDMPIPPPPQISSERMVRTMSEPGRPPQQRSDPVPSFSHPLPYQQPSDERGNTDNNVSGPPDRPSTANGVPSKLEALSQNSKARPTLKRTSPIPSNANLQEIVTAATGVQPVERNAIRRSDSSPSVTVTNAGKEGTRKSSWAWLMIGSEGDKDKDGSKDSKNRKIRRVKSSEKNLEKERENKLAKEREEEKKREKEIERMRAQELRAEQEALHKQTHARLDVIPKSLEIVPKVSRRESVDAQDRPTSDALELERSREKEKASRKSKESNHERETPKKESGIFSSIFGGKSKKSGGNDDGSPSSSSKKKAASNLSVPPDEEAKSKLPQTYYYTRFPIHIERAIYRLSHLKLANPRRPLLQQVLLSNFMYAYLAKVQQMQPQQTAQQKAQEAQRLAIQRRQRELEEQERQRQMELDRQEYDGNDQDDEDYDFDDDGHDHHDSDHGSLSYESQQQQNHSRPSSARDQNHNQSHSQRPSSRDSPQQQKQRYNNSYQQQHEQQQQQQQQQQYSQRGGRGGGAEYSPSNDRDRDRQQRERQHRQQQQYQQRQEQNDEGYDEGGMW